MHQGDDTCWTLIRAAASGSTREQEKFARTYEPVVRAYLGARWRGRKELLQDLDDAVQEVFIDCLKPAGALMRVDPDRPTGFRAFLYGTVRNVALRAERRFARNRLRQEQSTNPIDACSADDESLGVAFDRSWALALVRVAGMRQRRRAADAGEAAQERVKLLHMRFHDGLPIREIARLWETDAARLHHVYATARKEFRRYLEEVVSYHHPDAAREDVSVECERLLEFVR